jgi:hypothetical protein
VIDPAKTCLFIPAGLKDFKLNLFERIGAKLGRVIRGDVAALAALPPDIIPIVGCSPELRETIARWRSAGRTFVYWDRGYWDRVFATWLPRGANGGMYRWHLNSFQLQALRDVPADRYEARKPPVKDWQRNGRHIVIAAPTRTYAKFHGTRDWIADTIDALARVTDRQLVIRDKESKRRCNPIWTGRALPCHARLHRGGGKRYSGLSGVCSSRLRRRPRGPDGYRHGRETGPILIVICGCAR